MNRILAFLVSPAVQLSITALALCLCAGCDSVDMTATRDQFLLKTAPNDPTPVSKARKKLLEGAESVEVVLKGRVSAGELPAFEDGKAVFMLTDATGHDENDDEHDPHTCPFCSRNIIDYTAVVQFLDGESVIETDSRELFDLKERDLVVIRGTGRLVGDEDSPEHRLLQVDVEGMHVKR